MKELLIGWRESKIFTSAFVISLLAEFPDQSERTRNNWNLYHEDHFGHQGNQVNVWLIYLVYTKKIRNVYCPP